MSKLAPWLLSVLLVIVAGLLWFSGKQKDDAIATQAAEILSLRNQYSALVDDANSKLAYANLPVVPVTTAYRKGILDAGYVLYMTNTTDKTIAFTLTIQRGDQKKEVPLTLDGRLVKGIGESEGWAFISGDKFTVAMPDHKPWAGAIP
jgi:hypothetical protein